MIDVERGDDAMDGLVILVDVVRRAEYHVNSGKSLSRRQTPNMELMNTHHVRHLHKSLRSDCKDGLVEPVESNLALHTEQFEWKGKVEARTRNSDHDHVR